MNIDIRIKESFVSKRFVERYECIVSKYSVKRNLLEKIEKGKVLECFKELGYSASYNSKERFYKLLIPNKKLEIQLNISLKYGLVEPILGVVYNNERVTVGGPFGLIADLLDNSKRLGISGFVSYGELKLILKDILDIVTDLESDIYKRLAFDM